MEAFIFTIQERITDWTWSWVERELAEDLLIPDISRNPPYHRKAYFWTFPIVSTIVHQNQWFYHLFMITRGYRRNSNIFSMAQGPCQDGLQFIDDNIPLIWSPNKLWGRTQAMWMKVIVFMGHKDGPERIGFNIS